MQAMALLLGVRNPGALGLKPSRSLNPREGSSVNSSPGQWSYTNARLSMLARSLENYLETPVVDQTGLAAKFDIDLKFTESNSQSSNQQSLKQALLDQLGLELVPTNMAIEMLLVEKAK
jgi:uncharacterized protein (TIGR03435 family)